MINSINEKPLVSYLMLTYNQEKYIRDAVESALSQTYTPLEIIISDDCSTDRTFEIINETVSKYNGPHKIILNRNVQNIGLGSHINKIVSMAHGDFYVMGAGDDIAFPEKAERFTETWLENMNVTALCSSYEIIDENGNIVKTRYLEDEGLASLNPCDEMKKNIWAGCSVAFSARLFKVFGKIKYKDSTEDRVSFRRAVILGKVYRIKEPLIYYRVGGISSETVDINKRYRLLKLHFYGLKNFFFDAKKVPQTEEIEACKRYIYQRCWIVLPKLILLKILISLNINPFPLIKYVKDCLRPYYRMLKGKRE